MLRQRAFDLHERARLGGIFYVFSWLLMAGIGAGWQHYPVLCALVLAFLSGALLARIVIRRIYLKDPDAAALTMRWQWLVLIGTAACWGVVSGWALLDPVFAPARTVSLISTVSLAMAFAQIFSIAPRLSLLCTTMVYLPMLGVVALVQVDIGLALALALIAVYLVMVILRSHREYEDKLDLEKTLRAERDRFQQQSHRDALTGLANRRRFGEVLDAWMDEARTAPLPLVLLIIDIDWFKTVNDRHGHAVGDACLSAFATRLERHFSTPQDTVARLGGEEFAVLIRDCEAAAGMQRAEAFRAELANSPLSVGSLALELTVSIGIGSFQPQRHVHADDLYHDVDAALYQAKASGRNVVRAAQAA